MDRKKFFKQGFSKLLETAVTATQETVKLVTEIEAPVKKKSNNSKVSAPSGKKDNTRKTKDTPTFTRSKRPKKGLKYPPGAIENFLNKCTGCGDCVSNCMFNAIVPVYNERLDKNIPQMDTNMFPCHMCKDWPRISSCKPKALKPLKKNELPSFGKVVFMYDYCLNTDMAEPICSACREICPLEVIQFKEQNIVFQNICTACGLCVQSCRTFPKALLIK